MSSLVSPVHTGTINGHPVRFFRSPRSPRPEMPWHSVEDLFKAVALPRQIRRHLTRSMRQQLADESTTVATADGPVVIASHPTAQAFLSAVMQVQAERGVGGPNFEFEYQEGGAKALDVLTGDLPPQAMIEWTLTAFRNTNGLKPGETFDSNPDDGGGLAS